MTGCEEPVYRIYTGNAPVYMSYSELRSSVVVDSRVLLENPGKVYFSGNYIFIVEELKGVHIYDNTDPSAPVKKSFIKIPGVDDIAVSGTRLYANSYIDLVVLDIGNIDNISLAGRRESLFVYTLPPVGNNLPRANFDKTRGVVIGWVVRKIKEKDNYNDYHIDHVDQKTFFSKVNPGGACYGNNGDGTGSGGSLPRFVIYGNSVLVFGDYLSRIYNFADILNPYAPVTELYASEVRTVSVSDDRLVLGSMYTNFIVDLKVQSVSQYPVYFDAMVYCDPVIASDTLIFLTSRTGTECNNAPNLLRVIGLDEFNNSDILNSIPMSMPLGLAKTGDILFVCDGKDGLKIFDASDPLALDENLIKTYPGILADNVFIYNDILVLCSEKAVFQFDYSDLNNLLLLSSIVAGE